ncbi:MAG: AI-2E family transporter [Acidaminococcaceae bacterium]
MNNLFSNYENNTIFKIIWVLLAFFIFYHIAGFLLPIILAIALAFALQPLANLFAQVKIGTARKQISRDFSIILAFVTVAIFLYIVAKLMVLPLFSEVNQFLHDLPEYLNRLNASNLDWLNLGQKTRSELPSNLLSLIDSMLAWTVSYIFEMIKSIVKSTFQMALMLVGLIVIPFLSYYFMKDWQELRSLIIDIFSAESQPKAASIFDELGEVLSSYVQGMFKLCILVGICITTGVFVLGIDYPLILGLMAMIAEVVPVIGPIIISIIAVFLAYADSSVLALKLAIFYFVFYQIDAHYLLPRIMGKSIQLHPVLLILSLLIGTKLFGILGLIFAVPVAGICKVLYKHLWHSSEDKKV